MASRELPGSGAAVAAAVPRLEGAVSAAAPATTQLGGDGLQSFMLQVIEQVHRSAAQLGAHNSGQLAVMQHKASERKRKLELVQVDAMQKSRRITEIGMAQQQSDARCQQLQAEVDDLRYRDRMHRGAL
jgi:hypothetical protein